MADSRRLWFYQADSKNVIYLLPRVITEFSLSQLVWLNEVHTHSHVKNIRHIMSHFPFVLSKLIFLQPTVPCPYMSKSLSVCTSIDVAVSIVTHYTALLLFIDYNSRIMMHPLHTACHYLQ